MFVERNKNYFDLVKSALYNTLQNNFDFEHVYQIVIKSPDYSNNEFENFKINQEKNFGKNRLKIYYIGEGSFDWYWLFTPQGKEIGSLGSEITKTQRKYIESEG